MFRLKDKVKVTKAKTIQTDFKDGMRERAGAKTGRFTTTENLLRTEQERLSNPQKYQLKQHQDRVSRHVLNITKMTENAYKTTQGNPLHYGKETNLKQSIKTTAMRMQVSNDVIARIESLDNKLLNELYQVTPDILQRVYIYAWRDTEIAGVFTPPDKSGELQDFFEVYDAFVETRSKYI